MYLVPHSDEQMASLKADIEQRRQILVPLHVDQDGNLIDGFARKAIADELGIKEYPTIIIRAANDEERRHLAYLFNANRRQLTATQRRELIEKELQRNPAIGVRKLARLVGSSPQTVSNVRLKLGLQHEPDENEQDEKKLPTVHSFTRRQMGEGQKALKEMGDDAPGRPMTAKQAAVKNRRLNLERKRSLPIPPQAATEFNLHNVDFREMNIEDKSAQLIIADPPYTADDIPIYADLAEWANRKLTDSGMLCVYCGNMFLPQIFAYLEGKGLQYLWTVAMTHTTRPKVYTVNIHSGWKPLVVYGRTGANFKGMIDHIQGDGAEKDLHEWQQNIKEVEYLIRYLSSAGDLIVSPFLGSGTDAAAAFKIGGRRFIGADIDAGAIHIATERLERFKGEPSIMDMRKPATIEMRFNPDLDAAFSAA